MSNMLINKLVYKDYSIENYDSTLNEIFKFMNDIYKKFYPDFTEWFHKTLITDFYKGNRLFYVVQNANNIYGIAIIKKSSSLCISNKICTYFLLDEVRRTGFGKLLINQIFNELQTELLNPNLIITVPEERLFENNNGYCFNNFLKAFGFNIVSAPRGKYRMGYREYIFLKKLKGMSHENKWDNFYSPEICIRHSLRNKTYRVEKKEKF